MHPPIMRKTKPILYKFVVQFENDNVVICDTYEDAKRVRDNMVSVGYDLRKVNIDQVAYVAEGELDVDSTLNDT